MTVTVKHLGEIPIEMIKIKNRYRDDKGDIELMAQSLKSRGQIQSVVVDEKYNLLAGERRILGAKAAGWTSIRAEMREGASDGKEVERDENVVRKDFTWVEAAKLEKDIFDLKQKSDSKWSHRKQADMRDVDNSTVSRKIKLAEAIELIPELAECETEDEAFKAYKRLEEEAAISHLKSKVSEEVKQAPRWAHDHYIVGDALEGLKYQTDASFDFAEVDPPYGIDLVDRKVRNASQTAAESYNEIDEDEFPVFMQTVIQHTYRALKDDTFAVFWFGMQWHHEMLMWLTAAGFKVNPLNAVWVKGQAGPTAAPDVAFGSCYEPFFLARKGQPKLLRPGRGNVFDYKPLPSSRKIHLTEKPQELLRDILESIPLPGSTILVPFLGSGATLRAAYATGHTGMGFDLSEVHKERFLKQVAEEFGGGHSEDDVGEEQEG